MARIAAEEFGHEDLFVADEVSPEGAPPFDLPFQTAVFAPGPDSEVLAEVSAKLRKAAGLPATPTGEVGNNGKGVVYKVKLEPKLWLGRWPPRLPAQISLSASSTVETISARMLRSIIFSAASARSW